MNSTELGEEVEIFIKDEDDFNILTNKKLIIGVDTVKQDHSVYRIKISTNHSICK